MLPPSLFPCTLFSVPLPPVERRLIKASHSHQAPTLPHKLFGMSNLSLMPPHWSWVLHYPLTDKSWEHLRGKN